VQHHKLDVSATATSRAIIYVRSANVNKMKASWSCCVNTAYIIQHTSISSKAVDGCNSHANASVLRLLRKTISVFAMRCRIGDTDIGIDRRSRRLAPPLTR
jgi:hypothetical protein